MANVLRGDVFWAHLDPTVGHEQSGRRPVLILSDDLFNERTGTAIAVAITSKLPKVGFPLTLELTRTSLPQRSWAIIGQIRTLSIDRLHRRVGKANAEELVLIIEGLNEIIGR